jgi:hypothetical protein
MLTARNKGNDVNKEEMERLRQETLSEVKMAKEQAAINKARIEADKAEEQRQLDEARKVWGSAKAILEAAITEVNRKWLDTGVNFFIDVPSHDIPMKSSIAKIAIKLIRPTLQFEAKIYFLIYGDLNHRISIERVESNSPKASIFKEMLADALTVDDAANLLGDLLMLNKRVVS